MYIVDTIKSEFYGLLGWEQNDNQSDTQLGLSLTASSSGMFFNSEHAMLTFKNIKSIAARFQDLTYTFTAWSGLTTYAVGDKVSEGGENYICIQAHTNQQPPNTTYWEVYSPLSEWWKKETEQSIIRAISHWTTTRLNDRSAKSLLDVRKLYDMSGDITLKDTNNGHFVAQEIVPARSRYMRLDINKVGLQLDTNQDVTVYLFDTRQPTAIKSETFTYNAGGGLQWFTPTTPWQVSGGGVYYLGYDQGEISGQSINGNRSYFHNGGSGGSTFETNFYHYRSMMVDTDGSAMWSPLINAYTLDTNYGINADISVLCDATELFTTHKTLFRDYIAKFVAIDFLWKIYNNPEAILSRHQSNAATVQLLYDINGSPEGRKTGLKYEMEIARDAVLLDFTELDKVCFPCKKRGSRWKLA